jgi:alpha-glucosidase
VIYQVYPRSFQDSDGDGVGDLPGIASRLDYLTWLGVDAVWLSPIFPSPMADFGYDVSDYCGIHPMFGTLDDFDRLVREAHNRGLKVLLDLVPNHTSSQHPWFLESRASRDNPKRDWYLWRDAAPGGGLPNNWLAFFGGPAWTWDEATGQFYCHSFLPEQPDLNWRNPEVQRAMLDSMRFWLDRGVDGFRVDVIWLMIKDAEFRDNPPNPEYREGQPPIMSLLQERTADQPEVFDIIRMMRGVLDEYDERMMIGEIYLPTQRLMAYYGPAGDLVHLPFNFQLILLPWRAEAIKPAVDTYEAALPTFGWPNWVLGNHDQPRIASRAGQAQAPVAAMLLLTLRGTPTVYYGDELGMPNVDIPPALYQDPQGINIGISRDPSRTPMQWDASASAGFTSGAPWLPLAPDYAERNVAAQRDDPRSILTLHRRLLELRRAEPALSVGGYVPLPAAGDVLAYVRESGGRRFLVALNFGDHPQRLPLEAGLAGSVALSTRLDREGEPVADALDLRPDEGLVVALQ